MISQRTANRCTSTKNVWTMNSSSTGAEGPTTPTNDFKLDEETAALLANVQQHTRTLRMQANVCRSPDQEDGNLDQTYWKFHNLIADANEGVVRLSNRLCSIGKNPLHVCPELTTLAVVIQEVKTEKSKMDDLLFTEEDLNDPVKVLKRNVAEMIEEGEFHDWLSTVTSENGNEERENVEDGGVVDYDEEVPPSITPGEVNRLYQLLVERKTATSLSIDIESLIRASARDDIFSEKQIENLQARLPVGMVKAAVKPAIATTTTAAAATTTTTTITPTEEPVVEEPEPEDRNDTKASSSSEDSSSQSTQETVGSESEAQKSQSADSSEPLSFVEVARRKSGGSWREQPATPGAPLEEKKTPAKNIRKGGGYPIWIKNSDVPQFIGPGGANSRKLKKITGVEYITADQSKLDADDMCPVEIKGNPTAVEKCVALIEKRFGGASTAQTANKAKKESKTIWILNADVPQLIGVFGLSVKALKKETGATKILADQENLNERGLCPILIEGPTVEAVEAAAAEIKKQYIDGRVDAAGQEKYSNLRQRKNSETTVWIMNADIPDLIGPRGNNIKAIISRTGAQSITAWQERVGSDGWCPVVVKGPGDSIEMAVEEILALYEGHIGNPPGREPEKKTVQMPERPTLLLKRPAASPTEKKDTLPRTQDTTAGEEKKEEEDEAIIVPSPKDPPIPDEVATTSVKNAVIGPKSDEEFPALPRSAEATETAPTAEPGNEPVNESSQHTGVVVESADIPHEPEENVVDDGAASKSTQAVAEPAPEIKATNSSSSANASKEKVEKVSQTIWIANASVPDMIGPKGNEVKALIAKTGVQSITAWQKRVKKDGLCPIEVKGPSESVVSATSEILNKFGGQTDEEHSAATKNTKKSGAKKTTAKPSPAPQATAESRGDLDTASEANNSGNKQQKSADARDTTPAEIRTLKVPTSVAPSAFSPMLQYTLGANNDAIFSPNHVPLVPTAMTAHAKVPSVSGVSTPTMSTIQPTSPEFHPEATILSFLSKNTNCLTCPAVSFSAWLESVAITNFEDLSEALDDKDFALEEMQPNGLKYFKRIALRKAIPPYLQLHREAGAHSQTYPAPNGNAVQGAKEQGAAAVHQELYCPITLELMVNDPVLAADGYTYERKSIEDWYSQSQRDGNASFVLSPVTGQPLLHLSLTPNSVVRSMAREFARGAAAPGTHFSSST